MEQNKFFEFVCDSCNEVYDIYCTLSEKDKGFECEDCKVPLRQKFGCGLVTFKGTGFTKSST